MTKRCKVSYSFEFDAEPGEVFSAIVAEAMVSAAALIIAGPLSDGTHGSVPVGRVLVSFDAVVRPVV